MSHAIEKAIERLNELLAIEPSAIRKMFGETWETTRTLDCTIGKDTKAVSVLGIINTVLAECGLRPIAKVVDDQTGDLLRFCRFVQTAKASDEISEYPKTIANIGNGEIVAKTPSGPFDAIIHDMPILSGRGRFTATFDRVNDAVVYLRRVIRGK